MSTSCARIIAFGKEPLVCHNKRDQKYQNCTQFFHEKNGQEEQRSLIDPRPQPQPHAKQE